MPTVRQTDWEAMCENICLQDVNTTDVLTMWQQMPFKE